jgi:pseudaminic acid synthase
MNWPKTLVIAELSGNHKGSLSRALELVEAAYKSGAHAIKLQTYTADTMTLDVNRDEFKVTDPSSFWFGRSLYDLYTEGSTPWEWHAEIFDYATKLGMWAFSTPFDLSAIEFLESLNVPFYKVASFEVTDKQLIQGIAKTGKDLIMSTGMATVDQIKKSVGWYREISDGELTLLKCTSSYPAPLTELNLNAMTKFREVFKTDYGLSDHTLGITASIAAVALGAKVIEKHLTLDRNDGAIDSLFSIEPTELTMLVKAIEEVHVALGSEFLGVSKSENQSSLHRRSIYFVNNLAKGQKIKSVDVKSIRPGLGLETEYLEKIIGKTTSQEVYFGTPTSLDNINFS